MKQKQGFTLIELLIVIAIIAILAAVVFVALDPLKRFQDARDARRWSDVDGIISATKLSQVDNEGDYITTLKNAGNSANATTYYMIGTAGTGCIATTCVVTVEPVTALGTDCLDLTQLVTDEYLAEIPTAPTKPGGTTWLTGTNGTGYLLHKTGKNVWIRACEPDGAGTIEIKR